jgi:hypothetical protein
MSERTLAMVADPRLLHWLDVGANGFDSVVEYGCGYGTYLCNIQSPCKVGIEAFPHYVNVGVAATEGMGVIFVTGDMREVVVSGGLALFIDSLEHITKEDGLALLRKCQQRHRKIMIFAPLGDHDQEPCDGNEMQRHLSSWSGADLEPLGFKIVPLINYHHSNEAGKRDAFFADWVRP